MYFFVENYIDFLNFIQEYINDKYLKRNYYKKIEFWKDKNFSYSKNDGLHLKTMVYRCPFNNCTAISKRILFYYNKAINIHKYNIFEKKNNIIENQRKIAEQEEENLKKLHYPTEINRIKNNYKKN